MTWTALAAGEPIALEPGARYALVASIKRTHVAADVQAIGAQKGLHLTSYGEEGQVTGLGPDPRAPDYRMVAAIAMATAPGELPWSVPWPLSMADASGIVAAWIEPPGSAPAPAPPAPVGVPRPTVPPLWPLALGIAAAGAAGWLYTHRRR